MQVQMLKLSKPYSINIPDTSEPTYIDTGWINAFTVCKDRAGEPESGWCATRMTLSSLPSIKGSASAIAFGTSQTDTGVPSGFSTGLQRPDQPPKGVTWYAHLYKRLGLVQLEGWTPLR